MDPPAQGSRLLLYTSVEKDRYDDFSYWVTDLGEDKIMGLDFATDEEVDDAWVETDEWGGGMHLFWSPGGSHDVVEHGLRHDCEVVVTTKPPCHNDRNFTTIVVTKAEQTKNGHPRFLTLLGDSLHYYEVWMGKTFFWRADPGPVHDIDIQEEYREEDSEVITECAEIRKRYLDSMGIYKPWTLLGLERALGGCMIDPKSPAHPVNEEAQRRRRELAAWRFAINKKKRKETLRAQAAASYLRATGGKRRVPDFPRVGAAAEGRATRQQPAAM